MQTETALETTIPKKPKRPVLPPLPPRETRQSAAASSASRLPEPPEPEPEPQAPPPPREPQWNPHLLTLDPIDFPPPELLSQLQPDDATDEILLMCARALAMCGNRALCPKEIAEVMMYRGWTCTGSQPFAIVSTCIRKHLQRRGFGVTNSSHGKPARPGLPPPLFASYELTGPPLLLEAIGIDPEAKPAVKRGTLWYLSEEGTGLPSPFGELDPNRHISNIPEPPKPKPAPAPRRQPAPPLPAPIDIEASLARMRQDSPEDSLTMGRGKRKRKVSGIAGGDAAWHASSHPARAVLPSLAESSDESTPTPPLASSLPAQSQIRKIRVRLGNLNGRAHDPFGEGPVLCAQADSSDDESSSETETCQQRRFKKRSKSEGNLLALPGVEFPRPPTALSVGATHPFSNMWALRSNGNQSAATSIASTDLRLERLEEDAMEEDDDVQLDGLLARPRGDEPDDFHEAMLKPNFDFDFDFVLRGANAASPDDAEYDTPATTPRSWTGSIKEPFDADLYKQAAANHRSGAASTPVLDTEGAAAGEVMLAGVAADLSTSSPNAPAATDALLSPAPELPSLPIATAARTIGFAPAVGALDEAVSPRSEESRAASVFSHRSFSPASPFASPPASREPSPLSDADSFDAELVVKSEPSPEYVFDASSPIPPFDDEDTFGAPAEDGFETYEEITNLDMADLDLVRWGSTQGPSSLSSPNAKPGRKLRSGKTTTAASATGGFFSAMFGVGGSPSKEPPTPFGPEVFGFTSAPLMEWKPLCSVASSPEDSTLRDLSLDMIAAEEASTDMDVDMDEPVALTAKEILPAKMEAPISVTVLKATNNNSNPASSPAHTRTTRKGKEEQPPSPPAKTHARRTSSRLSRK